MKPAKFFAQVVVTAKNGAILETVTLTQPYDKREEAQAYLDFYQATVNGNFQKIRNMIETGFILRMPKEELVFVNRVVETTLY